MEINIYSFLEGLNVGTFFNVLANTAYSPKLDLSIEGMRSQQFSTGVFFFMLLGVLVFSGIVTEVRAATPEELHHGHVHGPEGHHH